MTRGVTFKPLPPKPNCGCSLCDDGYRRLVSVSDTIHDALGFSWPCTARPTKTEVRHEALIRKLNIFGFVKRYAMGAFNKNTTHA